MTGNPFISQPVPQDYNKSFICIQWSCTFWLLKGGVLGNWRLLEVKNIATNKNIFPFEPRTALQLVGSIHSEVLISPSDTLLQYRNDEAFSFFSTSKYLVSQHLSKLSSASAAHNQWTDRLLHILYVQIFTVAKISFYGCKSQ